MRQIGVRAAEIEVEFYLDHGSPFLPKGPDLALEGPGVARLLIDLPIGLGDGSRPHQPARIEIGERSLAFPLLDPLADPRGIDPGVDHEMGDMDALWPELARRTLRQSAQAELGAGEGGVTDPAAQAGGGASEEDVAAATREHQTRRLATGQETRVAGHFPDLAEYPLGGLDQRETDVRPDVEDADIEGSSRVGIPQKCGHFFLFAGIQRAPDDPPAGRLDLGHQRCQLFATPPPRKDNEPLACKFSGDGGADKIAGANHRGRRVPLFQDRPPLSLNAMAPMAPSPG